MIYCIWYPSGGFGHFVNAVLSLHGENFMRPKNTLTFSQNGDSHSLELVAPKYVKDREYTYNFLPDVNYSVLIDNGIINEQKEFLDIFLHAKIIKMCYNDLSWPVVAKTMIDKAMRSSIQKSLDLDDWSADEPWARREKYFLFLRDNNLRYKWRIDKDCTNIDVTDLLEYDHFKSALVNSGINISNFKILWEEWLGSNFQYFIPIKAAQSVISNVKDKKNVDMSMITDLWAQAVIYYYIWLEFNIEIPHNNYSNFFTNTEEIRTFLEENKAL